MPTCKVTPGKYATASSWEPEEKPVATTDALFAEKSATGATMGIEANAKARSVEAVTAAKGKLNQSAVKWEIGGSTANPSNVALKFAAGMEYSAEAGSEIIFVSSFATTAQTITTAGATGIKAVVFNGKGKWKLEDKLGCASLKYEQGTLETNNQSVEVNGTLTLATTAASTLSLGSSSIVVQKWVVTAVTGLTFKAETSTIEVTLNGAFGGVGLGLTYNVVTLAHDNVNVQGANTFATLNVNNKGGATGITLEKSVTQNVTTIATNGSEASPAKVVSSEAGVAATIKLTGTQTVSFVKFKDIHVTSGALKVKIPAGTKAEYDLGGNEGITFEEEGKKTVEETVVMRAGTAISQAAQKVATAVSTVVSGSRTSSEAKKVATASTTLLAGARTSATAQRAVQGTAALAAGARIVTSAVRVLTGTATLTAGARTSSAAQRAAQGTATASAGARTSSSAKLVATGTATVRAGARLLVTVSGQKVFEATVTMLAGARTGSTASKVATGAVAMRAGAVSSSQAVKVATGAATVRAGASTSSTAKRAAQEAATLRAGARTASAARMVAVATVQVHAGARIASSARVTFTGVVRMAAGARIIVSTERPPPPPLKPGPIGLGEDLALVMGVDLGPTTGEAR